jgi:GT2 family glycosyltransferase
MVSAVVARPNVTPTTASVVICAYTDQRWAQLLAAAESVRTQTRAADQLVVVIDHNDDLLARARAALPDATVVPNGGPRGLSGGRNTGVELATGEIVAFLDDDAVAERGWLEHMTGAFASPAVAGAGGLAVPSWETRRPGWFPEEFFWVIGCSYRGMPTSRERVRNPIGCNMAFRRRVFAEIGGFRDDFGIVGRRPVGAEETELSIRLAERLPDARIVFVPDAAVRHFVPADRATWRYFATRCYREGIGKARLRRLAGGGGALSTELRYVTRTLPSGIVRGLAASLRRRNLDGIGRATAIAVGLTLTGVGFVVGTVRR